MSGVIFHKQFLKLYAEDETKQKEPAEKVQADWE